MTYESLAAQLKEKNIRPSYQRIRILWLLRSGAQHPTAEQIFHELKAEIPALSRSTVYNTLLTFSEAGLIRMIRIEENVARFDSNMIEHGHFQCQCCGAIQNFAADLDSMVTDGLTGCAIKERHVYYEGICQQCLSQQRQEAST